MLKAIRRRCFLAPVVLFRFASDLMFLPTLIEFWRSLKSLTALTVLRSLYGCNSIYSLVWTGFGRKRLFSSKLTKYRCFNFQVRYFWPQQQLKDNGLMMEKETFEAKKDTTTYMSDELGLHRVYNTSHSNSAVSLHLYSPPFKSCQV